MLHRLPERWLHCCQGCGVREGTGVCVWRLQPALPDVCAAWLRFCSVPLNFHISKGVSAIIQ